MSICECIVISLCIIVVGLWGLIYLAGKTGLIEDEKNNVKPAEKSTKKNKKTKKDTK